MDDQRRVERELSGSVFFSSFKTTIFFVVWPNFEKVHTTEKLAETRNILLLKFKCWMTIHFWNVFVNANRVLAAPAACGYPISTIFI